MHIAIDEFEQLVEEFSKCAVHRETISEIGALPEQDFKFHWKPYVRGKPSFGHVFLIWEPPSAEQSGAYDSPAEGIVNVPLQFFIREFLIARVEHAGFLITNMAKCSMKTGSLCDHTRDDRFTACFRYLEREVHAATAQNKEIVIVSVGQEPKRFLDNNPVLGAHILGQNPVRLMTHYSSRCNSHFHRFADERSQEFGEFTRKFRSGYEEFIHNGDKGNFSCHWNWYSDKLSHRIGDLERLFKWKVEIAHWPAPIEVISPNTLSTMQTQRVSTCNHIAQTPPDILCDEIPSGS
jgi:hypothetical protein